MSAKSKSNQAKLIECQTCFRTFYTQAQFGQHSRICRGQDSSITSQRKFINIESSNRYKYTYLEKQTKNQLEIKSRFLINIISDNNSLQQQSAESHRLNWKQTAKKNNLHDNGIKQLLTSHNLEKVHFTVRHRKESGLIVANFIIRNVPQTSENIHYAKIEIEKAIDIVMNKLPFNISMQMHLCKVPQCKELVIRDTEGWCSRHRAQKYHRRSTSSSSASASTNIKRKRALSDIITKSDCNQVKNKRNKRLKLHQLLPPDLVPVPSPNINNANNPSPILCKAAIPPPLPPLPLFNYNMDNNYNSMSSSCSVTSMSSSSSSSFSDLGQIPIIEYNDNNNYEMTQQIPMDPFMDNMTNLGFPDFSFSSMSLSTDGLYNFFMTNCYIFQCPYNLYNVSISESLLRQNGMNLVSINYSTIIPNPKQVLLKNDYLITFGLRKDIQSYFSKFINLCGSIKLESILINNQNSIRFKQFVTDFVNHYIIYIPVPSYLIGTTLSQIPLSEYGINVISMNLNIEHPIKMLNTPFQPNDMLLCCFNRADDKQKQLFNAFDSAFDAIKNANNL